MLDALRAAALAILVPVLLLPAAAQDLPPANFSGTVHGVSKKHITIETVEGNLLDFDITGKTHVLRGKQKIQADALEVGDAVKIEARQLPSRRQQFLEALTITAPDKPKE